MGRPSPGSGLARASTLNPSTLFWCVSNPPYWARVLWHVCVCVCKRASTHVQCACLVCMRVCASVRLFEREKGVREG